MKPYILLLIFCFSIVAATAQDAEVLDNTSIIELSTAGISKKLILTKIESTACNFVTDTKSLISLKKAGVNAEIIDTMVEKMRTQKRSETPAATAKKPAKEIKDAVSHTLSASASKAVAMLKEEGSGIYFYQAAEAKVYELESTVFSQAKNSSWATAFSYGFAKSSKVMSVSGSEANVQYNTNQPVFYFYFDPENKSLNAQAPTWFASVSSPNEFLLIKFENKKVKNSRAVTTASSNAYEQAQGIDDRFKSSFKFKRIEKGVYEIYFEKPLDAGEYGFMYAGATATNGGSSPRVYDFGIREAVTK